MKTRFWQRIVVDKSGVLTVFRTTSALLLGNALVVPILTGSFPNYWWMMPSLGGLGMIACNVTLKGDSNGSI